MAVRNSQKSSTMALSNMALPVPLPLIFWLSLPKVPLPSLPAACPDPHPCGCQDPFQRPDGAQQGERVSAQRNSSERWVYPDSPCPAQWQYLLCCQHLFGICGNSLLPLLLLCPSVPAGSGARSSLRVARWPVSPCRREAKGLGGSHLLLGLLWLLLPLPVNGSGEGGAAACRKRAPWLEASLGRAAHSSAPPLPRFFPAAASTPTKSASEHRPLHVVQIPTPLPFKPLPPAAPSASFTPVVLFPPQRALSEASKSEHPSHVLNSTASNPDG